MASPNEFKPGRKLSATLFSGNRKFVVTVLSSEPFASGGWARLFKGRAKFSKATDSMGGDTVALKVFVHNLTDWHKEMVSKELKAVQQVAHRYILPYIGTATFWSTLILISPYMENGNLLKYLGRDPAPDWCPLVATAVEFLHSDLKLVHGDLKCENVLVSDKGEALLSDFGLCTCIERAETDAATATGIRGQNTFRYAAPELLLESEENGQFVRKTPQTDVYAFGMMIIQAFTRGPPWSNCTHSQLLMKMSMREAHPRPTDTDLRSLPDLWWNMSLACSSYEPSARPAMKGVLDKLRPFHSHMNPASNSDYLSPAFSNSRKRLTHWETAARNACLNVCNVNPDTLAAIFGVLECGPCKTIDDQLKSILAGVHHELSRMEDLSWDSITKHLSQHSALRARRQGSYSDIDHPRSYLIARTNWFKSTPCYKDVIRGVQEWLVQLIKDPDVLTARADYIHAAVKDIVAHAGNVMDGLGLNYREDTGQTKILDVGIMRYPDPLHPYIKVYRVELFAWFDSWSAAGHSTDNNGIYGRYNAKSYEYRCVPDWSSTEEGGESYSPIEDLVS